MPDSKLTPDEMQEIEDMIIAGEEHEGFVMGTDVLALARMMKRLFGQGVKASKPKPPPKPPNAPKTKSTKSRSKSAEQASVLPEEDDIDLAKEIASKEAKGIPV